MAIHKGRKLSNPFPSLPFNDECLTLVNNSVLTVFATTNNKQPN